MDVNVIYELAKAADQINLGVNRWQVEYRIVHGVFEVLVWKRYASKNAVKLIKLFWITDRVAEAMECSQLLSKILMRNFNE